MKLKDHYSLYVNRLDQLHMNMPSSFEPPDLPTVSDIQSDFDESWNIITAFGNYLIEHNRTRELKKRIKAGKRALNAWNYETKQRMQQQLNTAEQRFLSFLKTSKAEIRVHIYKVSLQAKEIEEQTRDKQEIAHLKHELIKNILHDYQTYLTELEKQLNALKIDANDLTKNIYFQRLEEDYQRKLRIIQKYLRYWR